MNTPKTDWPPTTFTSMWKAIDEAQGSFDKEARAVSIYTGLEMNHGPRWGLLGVLAGLGLILMRQHKA